MQRKDTLARQEGRTVIQVRNRDGTLQTMEIDGAIENVGEVDGSPFSLPIQPESNGAKIATSWGSVFQDMNPKDARGRYQRINSDGTKEGVEFTIDGYDRPAWKFPGLGLGSSPGNGLLWRFVLAAVVFMLLGAFGLILWNLLDQAIAFINTMHLREFSGRQVGIYFGLPIFLAVSAVICAMLWRRDIN